MTSLHELEAIATDVARRCGRLIVDERPAQVRVADTKSSATDVVTIMDQRSEQLARELLRRARPGDGLFGEEGMDEATDSGITWVVDPIDGTVNYLYDIPFYAVSVAAVEGDPRTPGAYTPVAGAVYNPALDEMFHAHAGGGSRLTTSSGTTELAFSAPNDLASSLVGTGFSYVKSIRDWQGRLAGTLLPFFRDYRRMGSAAIDLCSVAAGRIDAYFEHNTHAWDHAAGWLIATEAGASVTGFGEPFPSETMIIAGRPSVVAELNRFIAAWLDDNGVRLTG